MDFSTYFRMTHHGRSYPLQLSIKNGLWAVTYSILARCVDLENEEGCKVINLREEKSSDSALLLAIREGKLELVCMLIDAGMIYLLGFDPHLNPLSSPHPSLQHRCRP
jgi:hypothetical protein